MNLSMAIAMQVGEQLDFPPGYGIDSIGNMTDMMTEFARLLRGLGVSLVLRNLILVIQYFRGQYSGLYHFTLARS